MRERLSSWGERVGMRGTLGLAVIVVAFAALGLLSHVRESQALLLRQLEERADDLASLTADLAVNYLEDRRAFELNLIMQEVAMQRDVAVAHVVDRDRNIVADGNDDRQILFPLSRSAVVAQALESGRKVFSGGSGFVDAAVPVRRGETLLGAVHVRMYPRSFGDAILEAMKQGAGFSLVPLVFALGVLVLLVYGVGQVRRVTAAAGRIAEGDLEIDFAGATARGDLGLVQRAFSHLVAALRDNMAENRRLAAMDPVTGLPNRRSFRRSLKRILKIEARRLGGAVLALDLDRFKRINDTFGHHAGDELLKRVGLRLQAFFARYRSLHRPVVARLSGDEFTILLPGINARENAELMAAQLIEAVSHPFELHGREVFLSASVGVALFPEHGQECDKLLRNADLAMYAAKECGRQTVRLYSPKLNHESMERFTVEGELRQAAAKDQLRVFYQPKVSCADGRIVAAEALMRWKHPGRGLLLPADFLSIAEEAGLIADLSWRVLEQAVKDAARIAAAQGPIAVAVNVSARQFEEHDFAERVDSILDRFGLAPSLLELELTESLAMREPERVIERMAPLKARGVRFAIDDFGTGYSSLSYLTRLPIDTVKIDRSFVWAARSSADDRALVTTILRMAQNLNYTTVAEGIETEEDFDFVRKEGATLAQGHLFSPPLPYQDFLALCARFQGGSRAPIVAGETQARTA
jgi:diguanylate cyclase (GGDEF)-like protein